MHIQFRALNQSFASTLTKLLLLSLLVHCKNIRRIYGRIAGNQMPGHVPLFFMGTRKIISHDRIGKSKVVLFTAAYR